MRRRLVNWLLFMLVLLISVSPASAEKRGVTVKGRSATEYVAEQTGKSWAIVIGIDEYRDPKIKRLKYAVADAKAVGYELSRRGYAVTLLLNQQATERAIESELRTKLPKKVNKEDRVLVYYAGHGQDDKVEGGRTMGYLLPVDGELDDIPATGISMGVVKELADALPAKQVLFLVDACYGGVAGQQTRGQPKMTEAYLKQITRERGRQLITAGGADQEALEASDGGHGLFTNYLLKGLSEGLADLNDDGIIPASELYTYLDSRVFTEAQMKGHTQRPELWTLAAEKGEFVFFTTARSSPPSPTRLGKEGDSVVLSEAEKELQKLKEQERQLEEQKKLADIQAQIAETKKKLEVASVPTPGLPKQTGKEITGRDGAPMVLVPAGEFIMGSNDGGADEKPERRVTLDAFYMDKYEVSTAQYAKFMAATGAKEPNYWQTSVAVSNGQKPVIGVSWHEATAYCRHYGERLPTEQEWEKAARGTDGRKYPWGNEEPTSRRAKYDQNGKASWNGYATLASVESYEAGKSPYGLYHMAGNVYEWTSSDYGQGIAWKAKRGSSWFHDAGRLRSSARFGDTPSDRDPDNGFRCAQDAWQIEEKKNLEVASVPTPSLPHQIGRGITSQDGVPMVLVPAGEFMMGSHDDDDEKPVHRVFLDDYYIDQYDVTTSRYAAFLQATGRKQPEYWNDVSLVRDGERPVIGVSWNDAEAYCRYYGKRLPTEAEWEKAARGTDGRKYPWGNNAPTSRHANFENACCDWKGYATLTAVTEHHPGRSPYEAYDMAGNVWQWVADWYDANYYRNSPDRNPTGPSSSSSNSGRRISELLGFGKVSPS